MPKPTKEDTLLLIDQQQQVDEGACTPVAASRKRHLAPTDGAYGWLMCPSTQPTPLPPYPAPMDPQQPSSTPARGTPPHVVSEAASVDRAANLFQLAHAPGDEGGAAIVRDVSVKEGQR
jgi:hypothetical protein